MDEDLSTDYLKNDSCNPSFGNAATGLYYRHSGSWPEAALRQRRAVNGCLLHSLALFCFLPTFTANHSTDGVQVTNSHAIRVYMLISKCDIDTMV